MLQTFLPLFAMTFFIVLFILMMQFLWKYVDEMTGKGLDIATIAELFFYAALSMVPMALPLSILFASLMTFGNLGEKFELTAIKAAGVSLVKTMRPLIILMILIATGAFFFQNNVLPVAQTKMWTLLYSMRQKSPEMEIPEKVFYSEIPGISLFVEHKDRQTGRLDDLMIYDMSDGVDNTRIILADSGRIAMTTDNSHLLIRLYNGEQFENLRSQNTGVRSANLPYRREHFGHKDILLPFDANFNRMDESAMRNQYVGKNISELKFSIDTMQQRIDSLGGVYARELIERPYFNIQYYEGSSNGDVVAMSSSSPVEMEKPLNIDSLFSGTRLAARTVIVQQAIYRAQQMKMEYEFKSKVIEQERKNVRRHDIEMHKKFTLSFACIIFFFIGAPLGAIIRKGGFGFPLVISVVLFIFYYIIDNTGYKMARDGKIPVEAGIWLSSAVLLPLGIFLTYKAINESSLFNLDAYKAFFARLRGKRLSRTLEVKEFTLEEVEPMRALELLGEFSSQTDALLADYKKKNLLTRKFFGWRRRKQFRELQGSLNRLIDYLSNSRRAEVITQVNKYPFVLRPADLRMCEDVNQTLVKWFTNQVEKS